MGIKNLEATVKNPTNWGQILTILLFILGTAITAGSAFNNRLNKLESRQERLETQRSIDSDNLKEMRMDMKEIRVTLNDIKIGMERKADRK